MKKMIQQNKKDINTKITYIQNHINRVDHSWSWFKLHPDNLSTCAACTGLWRVEKTQPAPVPQPTLPATHMGYQTHDNH